MPYNAKRYFQELPPIQLAEEVRELVEAGVSSHSSDDETYLHRHTQSLSIDAQHSLLGLPEALVGVSRVLGRPLSPSLRRAARAISAWACAVPYGESPLTEDWLSQALGYVLFTPHHLLLRHVFGEDFFSAVRFFSPISPSPFLYSRYGFIFPDIDRIDWIFELLDDAARKSGGRRILAWCSSEAHKTPPSRLPYSLLVNYGAKYIRRPGTHKGMGQLQRISRHLHSLLRLDAPSRMDPIWANPGFVTEDLARGLLHRQLVGTEAVKIKDQVSFVDFMFNEHGAADEELLSQWRSVRSLAQKTSGLPVLGSVPEQWVHRPPAPNHEFGRTLRAALSGDVRRRPFVATGETIRVAPHPAGPGFIEEASKKIGLGKGGLGPIFEDFTRRHLSKFPTLAWGDYFVPGSRQKHGDIDAMVTSESGDAVVIFEMKAINEVLTPWRGGYHAYLDFFRKVFLKSNEQLLRAERAVRMHGYIEVLFEGARRKVCVNKGARVVRCSVSMSSFGSLQHPRYAGMLLSHLAQVQMYTDPPSNLEGDFSSLQEKILQHRKALAVQLGAHDVLDNTFFLNMSMLLSLVAASDSVGRMARFFERLSSIPVFTQVISD